ncbi:UPF0058 family protein [Halosegnis marinus]|uniref:UPF0058 family protein n=1 Tax=Halosegnis marinus TaxID=3034023 RepID=A0ABD5ZPS7_9EURY|nr:UPF0058 family protein [Halosegnis sp. DT85]
MHKQELLHLHALFAEVRSFAETELDATVDADGYERLDVRSNAVGASRADHEDATFALAAALDDALDDGNATDGTAAPEATADRGVTRR